ncbi:MAG: hypothetical protein ACTJHT_15765, partial [Sphingobacterium sp.]
ALEWETEMQHLVNNYQCEWKTAVNDPQLRKRFVHFANAPQEKDHNVQFRTVRGQKVAADWNSITNV